MVSGTLRRQATLVLLAACGVTMGSAGLLAEGPAKPSTASAPPSGRCEGAAASQFDFWVGEWEVRWRGSNGQSGIGRNVVSKEDGGCVILEQYHDRTTSFSGTSISSFRPGEGRWTQVFMGNLFSYRASGGPRGGAAMELAIDPPAGPGTEGRIRFEDVKPDSFIWRFQRKAGNGPWQDLSVSSYRRLAPGRTARED
jgi:hypothetical protein